MRACECVFVGFIWQPLEIKKDFWEVVEAAAGWGGAMFIDRNGQIN